MEMKGNERGWFRDERNGINGIVRGEIKNKGVRRLTAGRPRSCQRRLSCWGRGDMY